MGSHVMFDDTAVQLIPADATIIAVYMDGRYKNDSEVKDKFPHATLITIAVSAADDAEVLDVEAGDATIAEVYDWLNRQLNRGVYLPVIYISAGNVDRLMLTMTANGFVHGKDFRLWSAHYTGTEHICGPDTCKACEEPCDWTQFTNMAGNKSLDESDVGDSVPSFTAPVVKTVTATVAVNPVVDDTVPVTDMSGLETQMSGLEATVNSIESYIKAHS